MDRTVSSSFTDLLVLIRRSLQGCRKVKIDVEVRRNKIFRKGASDMMGINESTLFPEIDKAANVVVRGVS